MNHKEHMDKTRPKRPCTAADLNFGGECFNCGFNPATAHTSDYERGFQAGKDHVPGSGIYCCGSQEYVRGFLSAIKRYYGDIKLRTT